MDISVNNLSIRHDDHTLFDNLTFTVTAGQKIRIDGPSGCGKSSLLKTLLGFVNPHSGSITINSLSPHTKDVWQLRHLIAFVTQEPDLGRQNLLDRIGQPFTYNANSHIKFSNEKLDELFDRFKLNKRLLKKQTSDLSGGEKQRIAIIIALLLDRPLMLLDEPASALDKDIKKILSATLAESDKTIIFVSHEKSLLQIADSTVTITSAERSHHE